jgi:hypothetical protein
MARPLTPTAVLEQNGAYEHDPQRRAARENEPVPSGPLGLAPERFTPFQRAAWIELEEIALPGVLANSDRVIVEMYCQLVARLRGERDDEGYARPLKAAEFTLLLTILGRFGMTPSDRARLKGIPAANPKKARNRYEAMAADSNVQ